LAEALRRVEEGASMIRTKGEPGTGNVAEAITHIKKVNDELNCKTWKITCCKFCSRWNCNSS